MKYRKQPVEVDAWPVSELLELARTNWDGLPMPVRQAYADAKIVFMQESLEVMTLEGSWVKASMDSMLIRGVVGEMYPCLGTVFEQSYGPVE